MGIYLMATRMVSWKLPSTIGFYCYSC